MTNTAATTYKILGTTNDRETCECCGKTNLKKTVALSVNNAEVVYFGTTCAAKALRQAGLKVSRSVINDEADAVAFAQKWIDAGRDAEAVGHAVWNRFGFSYEVKRDGLHICSFAVITASPIEVDEYNAEWLAYLS